MLIKLPLDIPRSARLPVLDGLKGVALVLVVLYHTGGVLKWNNYLHGEVGVDIFLLVTSFLLVLRGRGLPVGEFLRRRFFRIFPTYWVALTLFLLLRVYCFRDFHGHYSFANILLHFLGLHGFADPNFFLAVNDSFWFISILVLVYGSFLMLRRRLQDGGLLLLVCAITTAALIFFYTATQSNGLVLLANRVPTVFLGFIAGAVVTDGCELKLDWKLAVLPLTLAAFYWGQGYVVYYPLAALGVIALYCSFDRAAAAFAPLRWARAAFLFLGTYSYEIYLLHQPIIREYNRLAWRTWLQREPNTTQLGLGILGGLAIVIPASVLLHQGMKRVLSH